MAKDKTEVRGTFDKAKELFDAAGGETRVVERLDSDTVNGGCPTCHAPMTLRHSYREPDRYHFEGVCTADPEHNIERYGYYSTEGSE